MKVYKKSSAIVIEGKESTLYLDSKKAIKPEDGFAAISHAHSDHLAGHKSETVMTSPTFELSGMSLKPKTVKYGKTYKLDGISITAYDAKHILGSAQFLIEEDGESILYSGDFRAASSVFYEACEPPEADILIVESTYGHPRYVFPSVAEVVEEIESWVKENKEKTIIFSAYALGKAQELIRVLNNISLSPLVSRDIAAYSELYVKHGLNLDYVSPLSEDWDEVIKKPFIAVMSRRFVKPEIKKIIKEQTKSPVLLALSTGWAIDYSFRSQGVDKSFIFSGHSDFNQLIDYVERSQASKVFTVHGYTDEFARQIKRRLGIDAKPLKNVQKQ